MAHYKKRCLTILLSDKCNMKCTYCYCKNNKPAGKSMDMRFIKRAILDFYEQEGGVFVRFFGDGEPTLYKEQIVEITEFGYSVDKNAKFELQTNGTFDQIFAEWVAKNIDIVWISYDGTTEINDHYRMDKFGNSVSSIVEGNIRYLVDRIDTLGVRSTVGEYNVNKQREMIDKMVELGVKNIYSDMLFGVVGDGTYCEREIDPMEYAKSYYDAYCYAKQKGVNYGSFFTINTDEEVQVSCRACVPMPHLTIDGYVSCCDMGYEYNERMDCLFYGKYDAEQDKIIYDHQKIEYIRGRTVDNITECSTCEVKQYCGGGCIGEALNEKGSIYAIKKKNCEAIKYIVKLIRKDGGIKMPLHP